MSSHPLNWPEESFCLRPSTLDLTALAQEVYRLTCRTDFSAPGFCLVNLGAALDSRAQRQLMVDLKQALAALHETRTASTLVYQSAGRFDQQKSTGFHRDGGPAESLLMLGYEPTGVKAEVSLADFSRFARDLGLTPEAYLSQHSPLSPPSREQLQPYTTHLPSFAKTDFQILCVNNSCLPLSSDQPGWQGVFHSALILTPDATQQRVINSTQIATAPKGTPDALTEDELQTFITTTQVL
ncbi:hypothetical protein [Marinospirillum perlucidum]|uniref:hypothetical protein n=1 Tax=Marinospirillum perlucidum TaxID=1982602 RepID=UPI000DF42443|nr:hypothetical protein [Marinospirillum perlucidum]